MRATPTEGVPVATSAPDRDSSHQQSEFEDRTRRAWVAYRDSLKDLSGSEYEQAEGRSWDRLQRRLAELEGQRGSGTTTAGSHDSRE
jgi:hypothetical protein